MPYVLCTIAHVKVAPKVFGNNDLIELRKGKFREMQHQHSMEINFFMDINEQHELK